MNIDNNIFINNMCSYTLRIYENQFNILGFEKGDKIINYSELQKSSKIQEKIISQFKKVLEENDLFKPRDCTRGYGYVSSIGNIYGKKNIISRVYFFEQFIELYMKKPISGTVSSLPSVTISSLPGRGGKYPPKQP